MAGAPLADRGGRVARQARVQQTSGRAGVRARDGFAGVAGWRGGCSRRHGWGSSWRRRQRRVSIREGVRSRGGACPWAKRGSAGVAGRARSHWRLGAQGSILPGPVTGRRHCTSEVAPRGGGALEHACSGAFWAERFAGSLAGPVFKRLDLPILEPCNINSLNKSCSPHIRVQLS
uniref:Uncharacterized protein n=1 Tax=Setaria viridis TaxID=4556 RepID=A0A4U6TIX5_SETVI|nr:hypothetical protein SEVIR_8G142600v2 [Setaria viridis]